jgi:hypothetical protein
MKFAHPYLEIHMFVEHDPSPRVRASKHDLWVNEEKFPIKYEEQKFWKRAKSIAIQKQSREKNQFKESESIIDTAWAHWTSSGKLGAGW